MHGDARSEPAEQHSRKRSTAAPPKHRARTASTATATRVTHGERVIDASTGLTKLDVVRYVETVAGRMMPHVKARPCSVLRAPAGLDGALFFQKHSGRQRLAGMTSLPASVWPGHAPLLEVPTPQALASAAQMNVIEFHTWNATTRRIDRPDRVVFDLDPGEGVPWERVQQAATLTRMLLRELGLQAWLKTSGGKGLHLFVPLALRHDEATVRRFARGFVLHLERTLPDRFVSKSGPANRVGKVYPDWLRNGNGATTVAAFSPRARPGLGVSMPVDWDDLPALTGGAHWTVATAPEHLATEKADPWAGYWTTRQSLAKAIRSLGIDVTRDPPM